MEVYLDYALATGNPVSDHSLDGEVTTIPNTFEEAMESPQVAKWKETTNKEMDSLQEHAVFDLVSSDSVPPEHKVIGTKWVFKVDADHTPKDSCGSGLGTSTGNRLWLHICTFIPYPEHLHDIRHCCEGRLASIPA